MLCHVLNKKRNELRGTGKLTKEESLKLKKLGKERASGKPLDYVTGESFFLNNKLAVSEAVHLPRMETEAVALKAIELIKEKGYSKVLDLMTGSGCIALSVKTETDADVYASDISEEALAVARKNFEGKVTDVLSDAFSSIDGTFDLIVSNPPYVRSGEIDSLAPEVKCQPRISLDGGEDGLDYYRKIAEGAPGHLNEGGALVLEIGHDQARDVIGILEAAGFTGCESFKDLSGSDRIVTAIKE